MAADETKRGEDQASYLCKPHACRLGLREFSEGYNKYRFSRGSRGQTWRHFSPAQICRSPISFLDSFSCRPALLKGVSATIRSKACVDGVNLRVLAWVLSTSSTKLEHLQVGVASTILSAIVVVLSIRAAAQLPVPPGLSKATRSLAQYTAVLD